LGLGRLRKARKVRNLEERKSMQSLLNVVKTRLTKALERHRSFYAGLERPAT
jgi:hypothetical protein